ncbi:uncharacterized protein LOC143035332 [Oratosquilla oratoria]|uniref:uncharacterized protein LOC143035332 n=1 Tax=Oratosquilla oratoria TaxID=337810 RepID=UPI003F75B4EC
MVMIEQFPTLSIRDHDHHHQHYQQLQVSQSITTTQIPLRYIAFSNLLIPTSLTYTKTKWTLHHPQTVVTDAGRPYVWQQDSAPPHTSRKTQKWLTDNFYDFTSPNIWPSTLLIATPWTVYWAQLKKTPTVPPATPRTN